MMVAHKFTWKFYDGTDQLINTRFTLSNRRLSLEFWRHTCGYRQGILLTEYADWLKYIMTPTLVVIGFSSIYYFKKIDNALCQCMRNIDMCNIAVQFVEPITFTNTYNQYLNHSFYRLEGGGMAKYKRFGKNFGSSCYTDIKTHFSYSY